MCECRVDAREARLSVRRRARRKGIEANVKAGADRRGRFGRLAQIVKLQRDPPRVGLRETPAPEDGQGRPHGDQDVDRHLEQDVREDGDED